MDSNIISHKIKTTKGIKTKNTKEPIIIIDIKINENYNDEKFKIKDNLKASFQTCSDYLKEDLVHFHGEPFKCCQMFNFVKDRDNFLFKLKKEVETLNFSDKNNDLYKFKQTNDFKKISKPYINSIRQLFLHQFRNWLIDVCDIELTNRIDLSSSIYNYTDVLLCHDDELDTRRIAFAFYLVDPDWQLRDGGSLDLFNTDEYGQPKEIVKSLTPVWNSLSWFEVSEFSHHQVSEVLSLDKSRLSIHGWFHSKVVARKARHVESPLPLFRFTTIEEEMVYEWINPVYLDPIVQTKVRLKFEANSEIELSQFLREKKYVELLEAINSKDLKWRHIGPANKRNIFLLDKKMKDDIKMENQILIANGNQTEDENNMADNSKVINNCLNFLSSEAMFLILSNLTGLRLHQLALKLQSPLNNNDDGDDGYNEYIDSDHDDFNERDILNKVEEDKILNEVDERDILNYATEDKILNEVDERDILNYITEDDTLNKINGRDILSIWKNENDQNTNKALESNKRKSSLLDHNEEMSDNEEVNEGKKMDSFDHRDEIKKKIKTFDSEGGSNFCDSFKVERISDSCDDAKTTDDDKNIKFDKSINNYESEMKGNLPVDDTSIGKRYLEISETNENKLELIPINITHFASSSKLNLSGDGDNDDTNNNEVQCDPKCQYQIRKWSHGCYTMAHDTDLENSLFSLESILFLGCKKWDATFGGFTSYIAKGEDEELLTIHPTDNSLTLVYKDKETLKFVKHINDRVNSLTHVEDKFFYDIAFNYFE